MQKIILYYNFVPISDPEAIRLWQTTLCDKLKLKGRIIIADHGINGTLEGDLNSLKDYIKQTKSYPAFKGMSFKWSETDGKNFPRLSVKVRPEIVTFGVPDRIKVDANGIKNGGQHINPKQVHDLVSQRGEEVIFFDGRNAYEAAIGKFKNAVIPSTKRTRDFPSELEDPKYNDIKGRPVITYCTGGIRCEVLSMLMKQNGFKEVYQLDGGIVKYGQQFGDDGLWEGALYVFDGRITTKFSEDAKDIGDCTHCEYKTSNYENCANKSCNDLVLICRDCYKGKEYCAEHQV